MLNRFLLKVVLAFALILALLGGIAASVRFITAQVSPSQHQLACGSVQLPPCI
jgi:hypothetical protein